jgi:hypothetical protein
MAERTLFPEWRRQHEATKYPFSERASMTSRDGRVLVEGTFLDAALYPVGAAAGLYLAKVRIDHQRVSLVLGDSTTPDLATGTFPLVGSSGTVVFQDAFGRPAGLLVSAPERLAVFQSWGVGTHEFDPDGSEFASTVHFPTPEVGVRGFRLEDGTLFTGEVWLVGDDGVVFRTAEVTVLDRCGRPQRTVPAVRVDVVGDPLFRRRLCAPNDLYDTPRFIRRVRVVGPNQTFECQPDATGGLVLTSNHQLAADTVLRIIPTAGGARIEAVGEPANATGVVG